MMSWFGKREYFFTSLHPDFLSRYLNHVFVETGTANGDGIKIALKCGFKKVFSVEVDPVAAAKAQERFAGDSRVKVIHGDSPSALKEILKDLNCPITFWLDAHGHGHEAGGGMGQVNCPLLQELKIIQEHPVKSHTILIDDRRMFGPDGSIHEDQTGVKLTRCWGIEESDIRKALKDINSAYEISYADSWEPYSHQIRPQDVIVASLDNTYLDAGFRTRIPREAIKTIVECGANDGSDTLALAAYYNAKTYAFECNPMTLKTCEERLKLDERVHLVKKAVWDENTEIDFYPVDPKTSKFLPKWEEAGNNPGAAACFPYNHQSQWFEVYGQTHTKVPSLRLDHFFEQEKIERINLLCMDIQGAELKALMGIGEYLDRVDYIILEAQIVPIYVGAVTYPEVKRFLGRRGFKPVVEQFGAHKKSLRKSKGGKLGNVLFARRKPGIAGGLFGQTI